MMGFNYYFYEYYIFFILGKWIWLWQANVQVKEEINEYFPAV